LYRTHPMVARLQLDLALEIDQVAISLGREFKPMVGSLRRIPTPD
jgi:hypothetical protein